MSKSYPMTATGKEKLEKELAYLKEEKQKEINAEIKEQRGFCDFADTASYSQLLDEQALLNQRIASIQEMLMNVELIDTNNEKSSKVSIGNTVTFMELPDGLEETYTIVGAIEADPLNSKISMDSPIGQALLGGEKEDEVEIEIPSGAIQVKILSIT